MQCSCLQLSQFNKDMSEWREFGQFQAPKFVELCSTNKMAPFITKLEDEARGIEAARPAYQMRRPRFMHFYLGRKALDRVEVSALCRD